MLWEKYLRITKTEHASSWSTKTSPLVLVRQCQFVPRTMVWCKSLPLTSTKFLKRRQQRLLPKIPISRGISHSPYEELRATTLRLWMAHKWSLSKSMESIRPLEAPSSQSTNTFQKDLTMRSVQFGIRTYLQLKKHSKHSLLSAVSRYSRKTNLRKRVLLSRNAVSSSKCVWHPL